MNPITEAWAKTASESEFQQRVVDAARDLGWKVFHPWTSINSEKGFPDLTMVRNGRMFCLELKREGKEPTPEQWAWIEDLNKVPGVYANWSTPAGWDAILEELQRE